MTEQWEKDFDKEMEKQSGSLMFSRKEFLDGVDWRNYVAKHFYKAAIEKSQEREKKLVDSYEERIYQLKWAIGQALSTPMIGKPAESVLSAAIVKESYKNLEQENKQLREALDKATTQLLRGQYLEILPTLFKEDVFKIRKQFNLDGGK